LKEVFAFVENTKFTYTEVMGMPTYERRFYIKLKTEQNEKRAELLEEQKSKSGKNGKGERTTKISGDAVKKYSGRI
jgi:hypothetical protein